MWSGRQNGSQGVLFGSVIGGQLGYRRHIPDVYPCRDCWDRTLDLIYVQRISRTPSSSSDHRRAY